MGVIKKAMTSLTTSEEGVDLDYKQEFKSDHFRTVTCWTKDLWKSMRFFGI